MIVYIRANFSLAGGIAANPKDSKYTFEVIIEDKPPITVEILPAAKSIESYQQVDVSDELLNVLRSNLTDLKKLPENLKAELQSFRLPISNATRRVLNLIKFCFGETSINEALLGSKGSYWSEDRVNWKPLPNAIYITLDSRGIITLTADSAKEIQGYLLTDFQPFFALRHLHKAINEHNPRYKWIDATIAAELAIKEFLIRLRPEIETLLLEMPSPPIDKLYGSVLKSFTGQCSPKLKELREGMAIRNKLLHRPSEMIVTSEKANAYVHDVESAIYHLMTLLYPNDSLVRRRYRMS